MLGDTILEKRRYIRSNLDHLRVMLMYEPRGHADMYGALLVEKDLEEADMAVLFMRNEGEVIVVYAMKLAIIGPLRMHSPSYTEL